jgi:hypothetical protein
MLSDKYAKALVSMKEFTLPHRVSNSRYYLGFIGYPVASFFVLGICDVTPVSWT